MVVRDGPLAAAGRDDGNVRRFGQFDEGLFRVGPRHPAAGVYQGHVGLGDETGNFPKLFGAGHDARDRRRVPQFDFLPLHPGVGRDLEEYGTRTAGAHLSEHFGHRVGDIARSEHQSALLGHRTHHIRLVQDFMHGPEVFANAVPWNLAGDHEHGRGAGVCGSQSGGGVVETHARHHQGFPEARE